jgi:hypothetical protein
MQHPNGQNYCVGCEAWHFEKEPSRKQKFGELAKFTGKPLVTDVQKIPTKKVDYSYNLSSNLLQSLQVKLAYLSNQLNNETDIEKTKGILECIKICIENVNSLKLLSES